MVPLNFSNLPLNFTELHSERITKTVPLNLTNLNSTSITNTFASKFYETTFENHLGLTTQTIMSRSRPILVSTVNSIPRQTITNRPMRRREQNLPNKPPTMRHPQQQLPILLHTKIIGIPIVFRFFTKPLINVSFNACLTSTDVTAMDYDKGS